MRYTNRRILYFIVWGRFNFEVVHDLHMQTMWKSVNYMKMMMTNCSLPSLQVSCLLTPKLNYAGMYFQLPSASTFNFVMWYCVDPKFVEQQQYGLALMIQVAQLSLTNPRVTLHHD